MISPAYDYINGGLEIGGAVFSLGNVFQILKDKAVRGVYWPSVMFFSAWGWWNMVYYPALNQPVSFIGALLLAVINTIWLILLIYYTREEENGINELRLKNTERLEKQRRTSHE